jgi:hypothetical protein
VFFHTMSDPKRDLNPGVLTEENVQCGICFPSLLGHLEPAVLFFCSRTHVLQMVTVDLRCRRIAWPNLVTARGPRRDGARIRLT